MEKSSITCPNCGHKFELDEAFAEHFEAEKREAIRTALENERAKAEEEHDMFHLKRSVEILPSSLSDRPRLIGAATLIIRDLFSDYQIVR